MRSLAIALLLTPIALGEVREVPAQYATIQAAVDAAVNGDIVRVAPGQYVGALTMRGKALEIRSWDPGDPNTVRSTVLSNDTGSVILLDTTSGFTRLRGLTIMGDHLDGSGVDIARNSNAEIDGCRFLQNYTECSRRTLRTPVIRHIKRRSMLPMTARSTCATWRRFCRSLARTARTSG